jgi:hypothetical protein
MHVSRVGPVAPGPTHPSSGEGFRLYVVFVAVGRLPVPHRLP